MAEPENAKLRETIKALVPKIPKFQGQQINEETTKNAMVAPILKALGWDIQNPDEVQFEYKAKSNFNPVDYALKARGQIKLLIEAKRLGDSAPKGFKELLGNAAVTGGAEWGVLTDGDEYRIYRTNVNVDADEKLFRTVRLSVEKGDAADTLILLSKSNMEGKPPPINAQWDEFFVGQRVRNAIRAMMDPADEANKELNKGLIKLIRRKFPELKPKEVSASLALARLQIRFDASHIAESGPVAPVAPGNTEEGGVETFRKLAGGGKPILKSTLIEKLVEAGIGEPSANAYIVWAKREKHGKPSEGKNPFDFCIVEGRDERGDKIITRAGTPEGGG